MLTFDRCASVICFSLEAACEQELYKHVLPPQEVDGSLVINAEAGSRERTDGLALVFDTCVWKLTVSLVGL